MTGAPTIRTYTTRTWDTGGDFPYIDLPEDWEPGTPVLVVAGLPEGAEPRRLCDVPEGWEYQSQHGGWVTRGPFDTNYTGYVLCRPKPAPAPPATEKVHWSQSYGRHQVSDPKVRVNDPEDIDFDADGMVEVLVDPAPTGDDEPVQCDEHGGPALPALRCVRKAGHDGSHTWDQASADAWDDEPQADTPGSDPSLMALQMQTDAWQNADVPQADTPAPQGRWVEDGDGDLAFLRSKTNRATVTRRNLHWVDRTGWDALVALVRRDGTDPTPTEVHRWLRENRGWSSDAAAVSDIDHVVAAVRALRDGGAR